MPKRPSRSEIRNAEKAKIRNRNIFAGVAVAAVGLALAGAFIANGGIHKAQPTVVGTDMETISYSDNQEGFETLTRWGNSYVSDTLVEILPPVGDGSGGLAQSRIDAVRDENGVLVGCKVSGLKINGGIDLEGREEMITKEVFHAMICNQLAKMGILAAHDVGGTYNDGTDAGLRDVLPLLDARTGVYFIHDDVQFGVRAGIPEDVSAQMAANYRDDVIDCEQVSDYRALIVNNITIPGTIPAGGGLPESCTN